MAGTNVTSAPSLSAHAAVLRVRLENRRWKSPAISTGLWVNPLHCLVLLGHAPGRWYTCVTVLMPRSMSLNGPFILNTEILKKIF